MTGEIPGRFVQYLHRDVPNGVPIDIIGIDMNTSNLRSQTGEEFSSEFLRDCVRPTKRWPDLNRLREMQFNLNHNSQMTCEDRLSSGVPTTIQAKGFQCGPKNSTRRPELRVDIDKNLYKWDYNPQEEMQRVYGDEPDILSFSPASTPRHIVDSPVSYNPHGMGVMESAIYGNMKLMCSFGGRILPRPNDGKLRYVGGDTRIISIKKDSTMVELMKKTSAIWNQPHTIKYQLPGEDLDALISVCSNEDFYLMVDEYHEVERRGSSQKLRMFLIAFGECDSPNSFDGRTQRQSNADYQYVYAVNGIFDHNPQQSPNGHSMTSQTTLFGATTNYGQSVHRESPRSNHAWDDKDSSQCSSNFMPTLSNPSGQFFTSSHAMGKSRNQLPPASAATIQNRENKNSNKQLFVERQLQNLGGSISSSTMDNIPIEDAFHHNPSTCHDNRVNQLWRRRYHNHQYVAGTDRANQPSEMFLHHRSPSEDFLPYYHHIPNDMNPNRSRITERSLSDSQLHDYGQGLYTVEETILPMFIPNEEREKLPSLANAVQEWPTFTPGMNNKNSKVEKIDNYCNIEAQTFVDLNQEVLAQRHNNVTYTYEEKQHMSVQAGPYDNVEDSDKILADDLKTNDFHHQEYLDCHDRMHSNSSENLNYMRQPTGNDKLVTTRSSDKAASLRIPECVSCPYDQSDNVFTMKSVKGVVSSNVAYISDKDPLKHSNKEIENISIREQTHMLKIPIDAHDQFEDDHIHKKTTRPTLIVEDVTDGMPSDVPLCTKIVPRVDDDPDGSSSQIQTNVGSTTQESEYEVGKCNSTNIDLSMGDATIAEIEAGIYGLQIIKNSDIEELQELGSGTFGTVYFGKWRGTDVAIKRIRHSCFGGRSSEQERLTKDFWREAKILSTLHHPNILAFYGVVPDGPGGTLATVTEYMVNGSLRRALQKKDRSLDRRKKLLLALDAAFGMEYLHLKNIVHFDLKCDNLLINLKDTQRPICKVGDFGLSRIKQNTLVSGGVRGTLPWMAPELLDGSSNRVSEKVDVYSFGIALWEILTGEEPYANMHCGAIIGGIVSNTLRPPIPERCDTEWRKLMEDCWTYEPTDRPSFTDITNKLRNMSIALQPKRRNLVIR
ncbi:Serine/threonine-protein kinase CTR1 [Linum perenne]